MTNEEDDDPYGENNSRHKRLKWTIMVYFAGDNNLSANSIALMQELEAAACHSGVRVLACYDSSAYYQKGARYLEINHHRYSGSYPMNWGLHNDMVTPEGHVAVSPDLCNDTLATIKPISEPTAREGLSRFLKWALKKHRAEHYMLILFGHGVLAAGNTFLLDTTPPSFLRLADFTRIIKTHFGDKTETRKPHLDILACDNCVMNSVEAAYEIKDEVDYMIGSQDLMLAVGWPFKRIVEIVQEQVWTRPKDIAREILKACARRLLDYSLMDRSSEQAVCDLTVMRNNQLKDAVKHLAYVLKKYLGTDCDGNLLHPEVRDAVKLARLDAQAYWNESFVDLYDFCERLLYQSERHVQGWGTGALQVADVLLERFKLGAAAAATPDIDTSFKGLSIFFLQNTEMGNLWREISEACTAVMNQFRLRKSDHPEDEGIVPYSYYVGPTLQYSHGLSIYFPWTMPEDPIIFEPMPNYGSFSLSPPSEDYKLQTAFEEYQGYYFASCQGTDWAGFLRQFFKATLRNVRMENYSYKPIDYATEAGKVPANGPFLTLRTTLLEPFSPPANLQKSSPDTGEQDEFPRPRIKNYPRRFYLSPKDCKNRCGDHDGSPPCSPPVAGQHIITSPPTGSQQCVPYLGWKIRGVVAEVIGLPQEGAGYPWPPTSP